MAPAAAALEIRIAVTHGPRTGSSFSAISSATSVVRVGRVVKGNALAVRDPGVSQSHIEFRFSSGQWSICDLGSSNGTILNAAPVGETPVAVKDGDCVKIGESTVIAVCIREASGVGDAAAALAKEGAEHKGEKGKPLLHTQERQPRGRTRNVQESSRCADDGDNREMQVAAVKGRELRRRPRKKKEDVDEEPSGDFEDKEDPAVVSIRRSQRLVKGRDDEKSAKEPSGVLEAKEEPAVVSIRRSKRLVKRGDDEKSTEDRNVKEVSAVVPARRGRPPKGKNKTVPDDGLVTAPGTKLRARKAEPKEAAADVEVAGIKEQIVVDDVIEEEGLVVEDSEVEEEVKQRDARKRKGKGIAGPTTDVADDSENATKGAENGEGDLLVANDPVMETEVANLFDGRKEQKGNAEKTNAPAIQLVVPTARKMMTGEQAARKLIEDLDKMTLREWFHCMESFLPWSIARKADEKIAEIRENARKFDEFLTSGNFKK